MTTLRTLTFIAALAATAAVGHAQLGPAPRPVLSLSAGVAQFDLAGTGNAPTAALRLERAVAGRWLLAEGGVGVLRPREQSRGRRTYAIPELQLQAQLPAALVQPYVGAGVGWFRQVGGAAPAGSEVTVSGAAGLRVAPAASRLGGRAELRVRGIGARFEGSSAEWTAGLGWRF